MGKEDQPHGDRWKLKFLVVSTLKHIEKKCEFVCMKYTML